MNDSTTTIQPFVQDVVSLETEEKELALEVANLEAKLINSEVYKKLRDKKDALQALRTKVESTREATVQAMLSIGLKSAEFFNRKFTIVQSPGAVEVLDEDQIPAEYFKEKVTKSLDKKTLSADLKEWKAIDGVILKRSRRLEVTDKDVPISLT